MFDATVCHKTARQLLISVQCRDQVKPVIKTTSGVERRASRPCNTSSDIPVGNENGGSDSKMGARQCALAQPSPSAGVGRLLTPATSALHVCAVTLLYIDIYAMARHPSCGRLCTHQIHCEPKHAFRTRTGVRTHARAHRPTLTNGEVLQFGFSHRVSWNFNRLCSLSGMVDGGADMSLQFAQVAHRTACASIARHAARWVAAGNRRRRVWVGALGGGFCKTEPGGRCVVGLNVQ